MKLLNRGSAPASDQKVETGSYQMQWAVVPKVNLLPREIEEARAFEKSKKVMALIVIAGVAVCAGGVALAFTTVNAAQTRVDEATSKIDQLNAEKASYAEVPAVMGQIEQITSSRAAAMGTDVVWDRYLNAVQIMSKGTYGVGSLSLSVPGTGSGLNAGETAPTAVGSTEVNWQVSTLDDAASLIEAMDAVPGWGAASLGSYTFDQQAEGGSKPYSASTTVIFTDEALSHRFDRKAQ